MHTPYGNILESHVLALQLLSGRHPATAEGRARHVLVRTMGSSQAAAAVRPWACADTTWTPSRAIAECLWWAQTRTRPLQSAWRLQGTTSRCAKIANCNLEMHVVEA